MKKRFLRHTLIYTGFAFFYKGMSFLLIPFFTRYLTPEGYGIYALFLTVVLICEPLMSFCVHEAIGNVYFADPTYSIREYVSTFFVFCAVTFLFQMFVLCALNFFHIDKLVLPIYLLLAPPVALSYIVFSTLAWMWVVKENPVSYGKFNFCYVALNVILQVGAVAFLDLGWRGVLGAQAILALCTVLSGLTILRKNGWLGFYFDPNCLRDGLKFGVGYIPNVLAIRFNDSVGKLFVTQKFGIGYTGVYSVGQKLGMIVGVYGSSFIQTYRPWLFKRLSGDIRDNRKIMLSVVLAFSSLILFACGGAFFMYLFSGFVLGDKFDGALAFVLWSVLAYCLSGMYNIVSLFIYFTGKSWLISLLTVTATGFNVFFTLRFLDAFGIIGAAYAPPIAWGVTLILSSFVAIKLWR